jgi:hypothetical protein
MKRREFISLLGEVDVRLADLRGPLHQESFLYYIIFCAAFLTFASPCFLCPQQGNELRAQPSRVFATLRKSARG